MEVSISKFQSANLVHEACTVVAHFTAHIGPVSFNGCWIKHWHEQDVLYACNPGRNKTGGATVDRLSPEWLSIVELALAAYKEMHNAQR